MPKRFAPSPRGPAGAEDGALAVSFLRVSTKEQVQRGCRATRGSPFPRSVRPTSARQEDPPPFLEAQLAVAGC